MNVSGVHGSQQTSSSVVKKQSSDPVIKEAQEKIEELQKKIKSLTDDDTLDAKTKAEQKKAMQEQISELNRQIRERKAELRKQEYEAKKAREGGMGGRTANAYKGGADIFSIQGTNAFLKAQNSVKISNALGELKQSMEITAKRLSKEIAIDVGRGADTSVKENMLADLKEGIANTKHNQVEVLVDANIAMSSAGDDTEDEEVEDPEEEKAEGVNESEKESDDSIEYDGIKIEGIYNKDGNWAEEENTGGEYEDKA